MFSLAKEVVSLCKKKPNPSLKIMIVGIDGAGKTYFEEYFGSIIGHTPLQEVYEMTTIGVNTKVVQYGGFELSLWDIGGTTSFRNVWKRYLNESNCIIYCIDSSNKQRLNEAYDAFTEFKRSDDKDLPVCFILTKSDQLQQTVELSVKSFITTQICISSVKYFSIKTAHNEIPQVEDIADWCIQHAVF
ncbi:ADP-ribosylation factor, putative [Entamoeba nuttalli P19]|uniref:ADP-ribosylation factor, putative n=1 Tax=Entamoeba nuttalli (strain P19) TaxID=1076696 RepID=K2HVU7_ENTNP|nr:ADP-ribosylation factor, putative [Entamoeba nuttalli P19]EKE40415.1 ADP-ribosylation factor, putative [Entamoeba nuttalli P19]|eukprot:XP_008857251.1 ADP-ribosylation factor, putative [Entamoeba nuttalli P19]